LFGLCWARARLQSARGVGLVGFWVFREGSRAGYPEVGKNSLPGPRAGPVGVRVICGGKCQPNIAPDASPESRDGRGRGARFTEITPLAGTCFWESGARAASLRQVKSGPAPPGSCCSPLGRPGGPARRVVWGGLGRTRRRKRPFKSRRVAWGPAKARPRRVFGAAGTLWYHVAEAKPRRHRAGTWEAFLATLGALLQPPKSE